MRRREFVAGLAGAVAAWQVVARAQQPALPVIGFVNTGSAEASAGCVAALRKGLGEIGYFEGQNVKIEFRWADCQFDRVPALVADLIRRNVAQNGPDPEAGCTHTTVATINAD